jgi:sterol 3beta-glucosyltransferase
VKIAVVTAGTRGDVQPYVAVAKELLRLGHDVTFATHDEFAPLVRSHGLEHRTIRGSFRELTATELGRKWLTSGESPREYARYARELFEPLTAGWCEDADAAVEGADAVAFYVIASGGLYGAQRRGIPAVAMAPYPFVPTGDFVPLTNLPTRYAPRFVRRAIGGILPRIAFGPFNDSHNRYRASVGLAPYDAPDPMSYVVRSNIPVVHLFSEHIIPRPSDWAERHEVVGSAFLDEERYSPPPDLAEFLSKPAIYVGFGSMTGVDPDALTRTVSEAIGIAGVRAVVAKGWAGLSTKPSSDIYVVDEVPHGWLFPRVSAVVHHGGASTLAEGLRAGKPTIVAAFFGDQPFWGKVIENLGAGPRALLRSTLTAERLAEAIRSAPRYAPRAEEIGRAIRAEHGAERAALALVRHFERGRRS